MFHVAFHYCLIFVDENVWCIMCVILEKWNIFWILITVLFVNVLIQSFALKITDWYIDCFYVKIFLITRYKYTILILYSDPTDSQLQMQILLVKLFRSSFLSLQLSNNEFWISSLYCIAKAKYELITIFRYMLVHP